MKQLYMVEIFHDGDFNKSWFKPQPDSGSCERFFWITSKPEKILKKIKKSLSEMKKPQSETLLYCFRENILTQEVSNGNYSIGVKEVKFFK